MGKNEVERFLSFLAEKRNVAAATRKQALNALVFLYRKVLDIDLGPGIAPARTKRRRNLPTVLTRKEVEGLLDQMKGKHALMAKLLYGCGLRLMECVRLRIKDVDFGQGRVFIRNPKGGRDRKVILPEAVKRELQEQVSSVTALHKAALGQGFGGVYLPAAIARKYPNAAKETFSADRISRRTGPRCEVIVERPPNSPPGTTPPSPAARCITPLSVSAPADPFYPPPVIPLYSM